MKRYAAAQRGAGFTLLEILVAAAIVGILLSLALPSYRQYVLSSGRAEAKVLLMKVAANQERYHSSNGSYSIYADPLSAAPSVAMTSRTGRYRVTVQACAAASLTHCFVAIAVPLGIQAKDPCESLSISNTGRRDSTGGTVDECWW